MSPRGSSWLAVTALIAAIGCKPRPGDDEPSVAAPTPAPSFNQRVLAWTETYPAGGHGGYVWPAAAGSAGTTRDLAVGEEVIARGGDGNHCVGMTLEVFWRALQECSGGAEAAFEPAAARAFMKAWYVPRLGGEGPAEALPAHRLGERIALDDAQPGDFVQAWTADDSQGHSMVFLGWDRDDTGRIAAIRYWSSQPWTDGIGVSEMAVDAAAGFDPAQIYIARATCPAP